MRSSKAPGKGILMLRKILTTTALAISLIQPAYADPISDFLDSIFKQPQHYQPMVKYKKGNRVQMIWDRNTNVSDPENHFRIRFPEEQSSSKWLASYYGAGEKLNRHTANGEVFNPHGLTAAHRNLPIGSLLRVSHQGHSVVVRVNDRGPAAWTGRSLDLSYGAAKRLGMTAKGEAWVSVSRIK